MHRRRWRMNPPQLLSSGELLRPQRERKEYLRLAQIFLDALVTVTLVDLQLRKLLCQAFPKPRRRLPQAKPMMHHDQQVHGHDIICCDGVILSGAAFQEKRRACPERSRRDLVRRTANRLLTHTPIPSRAAPPSPPL